jgi:hypothetical protein
MENDSNEEKVNGVLADVRLSLLSKLKEVKVTYNQMIVHKKGDEFKQEYIEGFDAGAMFIIEQLFGNGS